MTVSIFRQRSRVGPLEKPQQNFPKSYVQSTHRQEWFDNMAMGEVEQEPGEGEATAPATAEASRRLSDSSGSGRETEDRPEVTPVVDLLLPSQEDAVTTPVEPLEAGVAGAEVKSEHQAGASPLPPPPLPMELDDPPLSSSLPARDSSHLHPSDGGPGSSSLRPDHCETVSPGIFEVSVLWCIK